MTTKTFERVTLSFDGTLATLKLNHPEVMNAVSYEMLAGLGEAFDHIDSLEAGALRCLMITGEGRAFCAGANLQGRGPGVGKAVEGGAVLETHYHPLFRRMRLFGFPVIAAVNGAAAGVGMSLALSCDLVLAAKSAYFLQAFRRIGLVPDGGSTWLLPRLIGRQRALELSMLGERLPAETALTWGLINRVYDDAHLMPEATKLGHDLANGPTRALALMRQLYWDSPDNTYEQQLNAERQAQKLAGRSQDFKEGVTAFIEKRPTKFRGV